jgi:GNAT superfamily N-acetyltransferase
VRAQDLVIKLVEEQRETEEVRKIALMTGAEKDEIDEMIQTDKIYSAQKHGMIIGFLALRSLNRRNAVEIKGLATVEMERRKGTARVLLQHAEEVARGMNANRLLVKTSNDNIPALALYQKNGFRIIGIKIGGLVEHHGAELLGWEDIPIRDEVTLEKPLSQR